MTTAPEPGPLGFDPEYRIPPLTREAEEFVSNRFPRVTNPEARIQVTDDGNIVRLDTTEHILHQAAEDSRRAIEGLTDTTLAMWLASRGWTVEPPVGRAVNYTRERGNSAADRED